MRAPLDRLWQYARPYAGLFVLGVAATVVLNVANLIRPWLVKILTDEVLVEHAGGFAGKTPLLINLLGALLAATLVKGIFTWVQGVSLVNASERTVRDLREDVYGHMLRLPVPWFDRQRRGDLLVRFTDDLRALAACMSNGLMGLLNESLVLLVSLAYMVSKDWQLTILAMVVTPAAGLVVKRFSKRVSQATTEAQEHLSDLSSVVEETVSGIKVVKAFSKEAHESDRFARKNESSFRAAMRIVQYTATQSPIVEVLATAGIAAVLWYCALNIISGRLTLGDMLAFWAYMLLANTPIHRLPQHLAMIQRGRVALGRLMEVRDEAPEPDGGAPLDHPRGAVRLEDVRFRYAADRDEALKGVTLDIPAGQHLALLGPNGAGKSTLVNLLPRFYQPAQGRVSLDGHPLDALSLDAVRHAVGVVPQDTFLFSGTVADNIAFARPDATRAQVEEAARQAGAHDFIRGLEAGYDTILGEKGVGLSGGQKQRIAIARMLLADPRVVILDEATSNLDPEAEKALADSLEAVTRGRTVIHIAHRPGAARHADRVVVLDQGRVAEDGTHPSLLAAGGIYWRLQQALEGAT